MIIVFCQDTEKSLGDLRRLAVTQTLAENHQLTLMWKTLEENSNNNNNNNNNNDNSKNGTFAVKALGTNAEM